MPFEFSPTVLIVEDEPHIRRFVRTTLEAEGCTCLLYTSDAADEFRTV